MATRKPVSVLPVPVGEATSTSWPVAISGQAADLRRGRSAGEAAANHSRTAGWKVVEHPSISPGGCDERVAGRSAGR